MLIELAAVVAALYVVLGLPLLFSPRLQRVNRCSQLAALALWWPACTVAVLADQWLRLSSMPRSQQDILAHPQRFFSWMQTDANSVIPKHATLVSIAPAGGVDTEPARLSACAWRTACQPRSRPPWTAVATPRPRLF